MTAKLIMTHSVSGCEAGKCDDFRCITVAESFPTVYNLNDFTKIILPNAITRRESQTAVTGGCPRVYSIYY